MEIVQLDFWQFAEWLACQPEAERLAQAATERLHDIAQALQEYPALPATGLEAALEQFAEIVSPVALVTDTEHAGPTSGAVGVRAQEES